MRIVLFIDRREGLLWRLARYEELTCEFPDGDVQYREIAADFPNQSLIFDNKDGCHFQLLVGIPKYKICSKAPKAPIAVKLSGTSLRW